MPTKVVLAYSGGLDTSAIIPWLIEQHGCEVIAVVGDVGQGAAELEGIEQKAAASGASACYVVDVRRALIADFAWPALMTGVVYENRYLLGTALARPLLAKAQVDVARATGADAIAHGCTGKGNDQVRFESAYAALAPDLEIIAPWRRWSLSSREDLIAYIAERGIPCTASAEKIYSRDANLWHISHEGGELEDPACPAPEEVWMWTASPMDAPNEPQDVTIGFEHGRPTSIDGCPLDPEVLVEQLNETAGRHGVGRIDIVENRVVGMKSRGCYETPAGTVLDAALRSLEELVLDHPSLRQRQDLGRTLADLLYAGQWFTPVTKTILAAADAIAEPMTGSVTMRLYKGAASTLSRTSPNSLYAESMATFGASDEYDHADAEGFIRLFSLPGRIAALRAQTKVTV